MKTIDQCSYLRRPIRSIRGLFSGDATPVPSESCSSAPYPYSLGKELATP